MNDRRSGLPGRLRDLHRVVERYTPDGTVGRVLFALAALSVAGFSFWLSLLSLFVTWFLAILLFPFGVAAGLTSGLLGLVVLWPVYLTLIGHVESASEYGEPDQSPSFDGLDGGDESAEDEPLALLKRRYAAGAISDEEFERRLDRLLDADRVAEKRAADARSAVEELERA